ncbi:MAG: hypothetical protein NTZ17_00335 [Phycisphaerae bacterium]|nr:hypothetical protein [Phycisphaerae bacterium]
MKQVPVKTIILLIALLAFAMVCGSTAWTPSVRAAVAWLDADPNLPPDPNLPVDPNASAVPQPEMILSTGSLLWLSGITVDPNEPNEPRPVPPEKV